MCYIGVEKKVDLDFSLPLFVIGGREKVRSRFFPIPVCYIGVEKKRDLDLLPTPRYSLSMILHG